jgi:tetratricopeptide (TPR) repeat protein
MKFVVIGGMAIAFLLASGLVVTARSEETPAKPADGAPKDEKKVDKTEKAAAAVKEQVAAAEKWLKQAEEELAKPENKRDAKKADTFKANASKAYVAAAMTAIRGAATLKGDEKQAFLDQYDKPNREKAIGILLELADAAKSKRRWQEATNYYTEALKIDPKNQAAADGIKAVQTEMKSGDKNKDPKKHY